MNKRKQILLPGFARIFEQQCESVDCVGCPTWSISQSGDDPIIFLRLRSPGDNVQVHPGVQQEWLQCCYKSIFTI